MEYPEGGTDGEDGGIGGEEDSDDEEEENNVIEGQDSVEAERSDGKDDPVSSPEGDLAVQVGRMREMGVADEWLAVMGGDL